jgi:hypothetical protein
MFTWGKKPPKVLGKSQVPLSAAAPSASALPGASLPPPDPLPASPGKPSGSPLKMPTLDGNGHDDSWHYEDHGKNPWDKKNFLGKSTLNHFEVQFYIWFNRDNHGIIM